MMLVYDSIEIFFNRCLLSFFSLLTLVVRVADMDIRTITKNSKHGAWFKVSHLLISTYSPLPF